MMTLDGSIKQSLGGNFEEFSTLDNFKRASSGYENRDRYIKSLYVKSAILGRINVWLSEWWNILLTGDLTSSPCMYGCVVNGVSTMVVT